MAKVENIPNSVNLIGGTTKITGDLISEGDIRIDGTLIGNANINGKLILGQNAFIKGNVSCQNIDLGGKIEGNLLITEAAFLRATASLLGDLTTDKLTIESGAVFSGVCRMGDKKQSHETEKFTESQENQ